MQEFKANMDGSTKALTVFVIVITAASLVPLFFLPEMGWLAWIIAGSIMATLFIAYLLRPVKYVVFNQSLVIKKGIGETRIALGDLVEAREVTKNDLGWGIRTFGVGGFLGYYGKFRYSRIGPVTAYVTDPDRMIFLKTKGGKNYLVSPGDLLQFMNALEAEGLQQLNLSS